MRMNTELQRETFSSTKTIISTVEAQPLGGVRLAKGRRFVRLQTDEEIIRAVAEREIGASPVGEVSLAAFLSLQDVHKVLQASSDPAASVRRALGHEESSSVACGGWLRRRPRHLQLRSAGEELFSDEHLASDSRLRAKMAESDTGAVPLTWLCSRYADRLGVNASTARAAEVSAAELCKALETSKLLMVDPRRLAVRRAAPYSPGRSPSAVEASRAAHGALNGAAAPGKDARVAAELRQLLDFYFEPFTLQHNRYLVDLVARCVGPPEERGPWVPEVLLKFRCTLQDLLGLGRIASALAKTKSPPQAFYNSAGEGLHHLKHLALRPDGHFQLTTPMEVRSFVSAEGAPEGVVADIVRYLAAAREQRGQAPTGTVSVASYALGHLLAGRRSHDEQTQAGAAGRLEKELGQVKRQIVLHHSDIVCLQGVDAESPGGGGQLAAALSEEGYGFACARGRGGEANSVFWDRSRWERTAVKESGTSLAADLRLIEDPSFSLRVACLRPDLQHSLHLGLGDLFDLPEEAPFIVCADLSQLGGAEGSCLVQELCSMRSAAQEVLGDEIWAPTPASPENVDSVVPARSPASGLNKLRSPDCVLYRGLAPIAVLSGHTEGYLATMPQDEVAKQFPAFRLPIVAAFSFCCPRMGEPAKGVQSTVATSAHHAHLFRV